MEGELDLGSASVPALAEWTERFADALELDGPFNLAGHDIGGALAQHLTIRGRHQVGRLSLLDSVSYDSWPVPGVGRFRNPEIVAGTTTEQLLAMRREALEKAIARPMTDDERADYLSPRTHRRVGRSWMSMADSWGPDRTPRSKSATRNACALAPPR